MPLPREKSQLTLPFEKQRDQFEAVIEEYGQPDQQLSTEHDEPAPPLPLRIIRFLPEAVKIVFHPIAKFGDKPPFRGWSVFAYMDGKSGTLISHAEAESRLEYRVRRNEPPEIDNE